MEMEGRKGVLLNIKENLIETVPKIAGADMIRLIVCGGSYTTIGALLGGPQPETKKIELPSNWDKLVKKYEGMVPKHMLY